MQTCRFIDVQVYDRSERWPLENCSRGSLF